MTIRIIVADDHPIIHQGVARLEELDSSITVIGNAMDGRELLEMCKTERPDIIILDDSMPNMDGVTAAGRILRRRRKQKIIFYTFSNNKNQIFERYNMGVMGYVLKSSPIEELLKAVYTVHSGALYFNDEFPEDSFEYYKNKRNQKGLKLTFREKQVMNLIAKGKANNEIAELLDLSVRTIEEHRRRVRRKFDLTGKTDLVKFAIEVTKE